MPVSKVRRSRRPTSPPPAPGRAAVRPPSPPWYGVLIVVLLLLAVAWIVGYTLGPVPGQTALGGWNYVIAVGLAVTGVVLLTRWR